MIHDLDMIHGRYGRYEMIYVLDEKMHNILHDMIM
jgi:hypothetical protein